MARKKVRLSTKQFFTITVLSSTLLVMLFLTTGIIKQPTRTTSDATGGSYGSLNQCSSGNGRAGGVELYNKANQSGGYRVMCIKFRKYPGTKYDPVLKRDEEIDKHLGSIQSGKKYYDIWNFNNKTESLVIRANPWCIVTVQLFNGGLDENKLWEKQIGANSVGYRDIRKFNLPENKRNKATSLRMTSQCMKERVPYLVDNNF